MNWFFCARNGKNCEFRDKMWHVCSQSLSCFRLCDPMDYGPPGFLHPWDFPVYWSGVPLSSPPYDYYSIIYSIQDMEIIWVHWWMKGKENMVYLVLMCFIVSYFTDIFVFLFNKVKHCGNPVLECLLASYFSKHLFTLCFTFWHILNKFQTLFLYLLYLV